MGLSAGSIDELNRIVIDLNKDLVRARSDRADTSTPEPKIERANRTLSGEEYLERHRRRFRALGISPSTQVELLAAARFTWNALNDGSVPSGQREAAQVIQEMMQSMGGPPPCCDDSLFEEAGRGGAFDAAE